jgi:RHS repeat-associated protein
MPMVAARSLRDPGEFAKKLDARSLKSAVRQRRHLATAASVAVRDESQMRFSGQSEDVAFETLDEAFPEVLKAAPEPIASSDRVVKYINNEHAAVVAPVDEDKAGSEARKPRMVTSTLPLRAKNRDGRLAPVSTDVTEAAPGELRPENALADVVVSRDLRRGIEFPGTGVALRAAGISPDRPATVRRNRVFWANVQADTDLMVNMLPDGVETYDVLRSRQSPERLSYEVDVPDGGGVVLDAEKQTIDINDKDGKPVAHVGPPHAVDADGALVPTRWAVQGTMLQIEVDHRQADLRYPILVDPVFSLDETNWYDGITADYSGWVFAESNPGALAKQAGNAGLGAGLNIWLPANLTAPQGLWGVWEFGAPGDTYVRRFVMDYFSWWPWGGRSCAVAGILASDNPISWNGGQVTGTPGLTTSPWGWCANNLPGGVSNWYIDHEVVGFTRGNRAAIEWLAFATANGTAPDWIRLGDAYIEITDDQAPGDFNIFGLPAGWTKNTTFSFSAYATDHGLGLGYIAALVDGETVGERGFDCDPDWRAADHCLATQRIDVITPVSGDGIHPVNVFAMDAVGDPADPDPNNQPNQASDNMGYVGRIDTVAPGMHLSGAAYDLSQQEVGELSYKLHVDAFDEQPDPVDVSGIGSIEFKVGGQQKGFVSQGCGQSCLDGDGAGLSGDFTLDTSDLADGTYALEVKVTDRAGNPKSTTWSVNVVRGTVSRPAMGLHVARRATLQAHTPRSGITTVRWEYRTAAEGQTPAGPWTTIATSALRDSAGNQPGSTTIAVSGGDSVPVSWDIMSTLGMSARSQALELRGIFNIGKTNVSRVNLDTRGFDEGTAHESIGPGQVNLLTGDFSVASEDVSIKGGLADLRVNATYNSRDIDRGSLGPGWQFSAPVLDDVDVVNRLEANWQYGYIELTLGDGTIVPFTWHGDDLTAPVGYEKYSLTARPDTQPSAASGNREYVLSDETTGSTTLLRTNPTGGTTYFPQSVRQGPPATAVVGEYGIVDGTRRIKTLYGPAGSGGNCSSNFSAECRALVFVYATTTTATGSLPANWGDYTGQLKSIELKRIDPATGSTVNEPVASYAYDSTRHLRASWDPRISPALKEQYSYDSNGLLISLTSAGETPWTMSYTQIGGETERGRLSQVSRTVPAGTATWTMAYNLPLSGTNAPMNMSPTSVDDWSQEDLPTDATAIFGPDQVPALPTSDYTHAAVHYLNRDAYEVNDLEPGGGLSTTERDSFGFGNVIRELSARNRELSFQSSQPAAQSGYIDTQRTYSADGLDLTNEIGPYREVRLDSGEVVLARRHTVTRYDETKPAGDTTKYHLPTTQIVSAQVSGRPDADARTTVTAYDWSVRRPTSIITGAQAGGPALTETMQYDSTTGLLIGHRQPKSPNSDAASTTKYLYYGMSGCGSHPEWYMMLCQKSPGAQPGGSLPALPSTTYTYNRFGQVTTEDRGGRVESTTYDNAGRETGVSWSGPGTAVPTTTITYDSATGREATRSAVVNGSTRTIKHFYDSAGQVWKYTDGTDKESTTSYDLFGRPLVVGDGKGTQTNTYDSVTGRLKQIVDSQAGTFSATYDVDGNILTKTLPDGVRGTYTYNEAGEPTKLAWVKTTGCSTSCTWLQFEVRRSVFGQVRTSQGPMSHQTVGYDGVGRMKQVQDTPTGEGCTVRNYSFDADSNRTSVSTYRPGAGGACDTTGAPTIVNHAYDSADRLIDSGFVYDAQGRTTTVPAGAAGHDALDSAFFADDLTRSQTQEDVSNTYDLDPARRTMVRSTTSAAWSGTETSHYNDDSDSPTWTATDDGHWSRNVGGVDGDLVATVDDTSDTVLQLTDLHGNVAATAATSATKLGETQVLQPVRSGSSWSLNPSRALAPGSYVARVRQNDASGNVGNASTHFTVGADASPDQTYRDLVMAGGPEGYWRLGESSGTVASDQTAAHNGTYVGSPALAHSGALIGDTDTSTLFDGLNDGVDALDRPWRSTPGFTVESWVKTNRTGGTLMSQGKTSDSINWKVRVASGGTNDGKLQAVYNAGQRSTVSYSSARIDDNKWHHVVVTFAMTTSWVRVTVDGATQSGIGPTLPSTAPLYAFGFDETSGAATSSGTATAVGTITGAMRTPNGRFGGALNFSSASTYVQAVDTGGLGAPMTVEAWVKPTASTTGFVVGKGSFFSLGTKLNTTLNPFSSIGTQNSSATTPTLPLNTWSHLAMTWDQATSTMKLYANAQLVQTITSVPAPSNPTAFLRIGAQGTGFFTGTIDEVKIYQRVLTQAELAVDRNVPVNTANTNNPSVALGLEENLGNVLGDQSGNNRSVTLSGTAGWALGKYGSGINFNGTNYGSFTDPGIGANSTGITLSSWIKTSAIQNAPFLGATTFGLYGQRTSTTGPSACASGACLSAPSASNGVWTHLTATYDRASGQMRLYVNGVAAGTDALLPSGMNLLPGGLVSVGRDTANSQPAFNAGSADEIRVYPRPLTAAEVAREWNLSVAQHTGGTDPYVHLGNETDTAYLAGRLDEAAIYPRLLTDVEIFSHLAAGSVSSKLKAPTISAPSTGASVVDSTPIISGTGINLGFGMSPNLRVDVFSGNEITSTPIQSLLANRPASTWSSESVKGLPAGTYTAKVTENDLTGRYGTASRTFTIAGATDPETGYATSVRSDNPRAYWRMGETSGTTAADDLTAHPGTYTGSPTLGSTGALATDTNKAPMLDGVNDRVDAPNTSGFFDPGTGNFSVESWVKTTVNGNEVIATKGTNWQVAVTSDTGHIGQARFTYANAAITAYSTSRVDDGNWHHVVAVANRTSGATVYVDGIAGPTTVTANSTALTDTNPVRIGAHATTAGYFTGQLDEIAVYNTALAASRILAHSRLGTQLDSTAPAPAITAPANEGTTTNAALNFTGTAGNSSTDADALTLSITPDPVAGPLAVYDYDEFGTPRGPSQASRYGYLGSKQRSAELPSGVIAMGARSYIPSLGRFLQVDPVDGGSANPYDYANQDPFNQFDLDGLCSAKESHKWTLHAAISPACWVAGIKDDIRGGNGKVMQGAAAFAMSMAGGRVFKVLKKVSPHLAYSRVGRALANAIIGYDRAHKMSQGANGAPTLVKEGMKLASAVYHVIKRIPFRH